MTGVNYSLLIRKPLAQMAFTCTVYCFHRKYINRQLFTILKSASSSASTDTKLPKSQSLLEDVCILLWRVEQRRDADGKPDPPQNKNPQCAIAGIYVSTYMLHSKYSWYGTYFSVRAVTASSVVLQVFSITNINSISRRLTIKVRIWFQTLINLM